MLFTIDEFVLKRIFTPVIHWLEYKTGHTKIYFVWWTFGLNIVFNVMEMTTRIFASGNITLSEVMTIILIFYLSRLMIRMQKTEEQIQARPEMATRSLPPFVRLFVCAITLPYFLGALFHGDFSNMISIISARIKALGGLEMFMLFLGIYIISVERPPVRRQESKVNNPHLVPVHSAG